MNTDYFNFINQVYNAFYNQNLSIHPWLADQYYAVYQYFKTKPTHFSPKLQIISYSSTISIDAYNNLLKIISSALARILAHNAFPNAIILKLFHNNSFPEFSDILSNKLNLLGLPIITSSHFTSDPPYAQILVLGKKLNLPDNPSDKIFTIEYTNFKQLRIILDFIQHAINQNLISKIIPHNLNPVAQTIAANYISNQNFSLILNNYNLDQIIDLYEKKLSISFICAKDSSEKFHSLSKKFNLNPSLLAIPAKNTQSSLSLKNNTFPLPKITLPENPSTKTFQTQNFKNIIPKQEPDLLIQHNLNPNTLKNNAKQTFDIIHPLKQNTVSYKFNSLIRSVNLSFNFPSDSNILLLKKDNIALSVWSETDYNIINYDPLIATDISIINSLSHIAATGAKPTAISVSCSHFSDVCQKIFQRALSLANYLNIQLADFQKINHYKNLLTINALGTITNTSKIMTVSFKEKGDILFLIGKSYDNINCSLYQNKILGLKCNALPEYDLEYNRRLLELINLLIDKRLVRSIKSVNYGGLIAALFKSSLYNSLGFDISSDDELKINSFLFGESPGRFLVSVLASKENNFIREVQNQNIDLLLLGHVTKGEMRVDDISLGFIADYSNYAF